MPGYGLESLDFWVFARRLDCSTNKLIKSLCMVCFGWFQCGSRGADTALPLGSQRWAGSLAASSPQPEDNSKRMHPSHSSDSASLCTATRGEHRLGTGVCCLTAMEEWPLKMGRERRWLWAELSRVTTRKKCPVQSSPDRPLAKLNRHTIISHLPQGLGGASYPCL